MSHQSVTNYQKEKYKDKSKGPRPFCYTCWKVQELCLCSHVKKEASKVPIIFLQHPNEKHMPVNTARLAHLSLTNSKMFYGINMDESPDYTKFLKTVNPMKCGILYPSEDAQELASAPDDLECLFLIDGTWNEAGKIFRNSPSLGSIPRYAFTPKKESNYRIRKEPKPSYVSSIEATVTALRILENSTTAYQGLLNLFDKMVENQLKFVNKSSNSRHKDFTTRKHEAKKRGKENWEKFSTRRGMQER